MANYVKFLRGTPTLYNNLAIKDPDTLYFVAETDSLTGLLYLGSKLITTGSTSSGDNSVINLSDLEDVLINTDLADSHFLVYDSIAKAWVNKDLEELIFIGATEQSAGVAGLVPAPEENKTNLFLRSDASWIDITTKILTFVNDEALEHNEIISDETDSLTLSNGDIFIVKDLIANNKYQHTAYIYDNGLWMAMGGNYNAENVYFSEDLITTTEIGNIHLTDGQATIPASGKNLKQVFEEIFVSEQNPEITEPEVLLTFNQAKSYEVGTVITPSYSAMLSAGQYSYGPATGIVATSWEITDSENQSSDEAAGTLPEILVTDNISYTITATATHGDGAIPVSNLGNPCANLQIKKGSSVAVSNPLTGYRNSFYGTFTNKNELTPSDIRELTFSNKALYNQSVVNINVPVGAMRVVFAYPATLQDLTSVLDKNDSNSNIISGFNSQIMSIEGANGYEAIEYKVYSIDFAEAYNTSNVFIATI